MSAPPFMPFYVGDYLADTTHLTVTEHGAYLLLLMSMWRNGGSLPNDDRSLARHARCTRAQWERMRPVLAPFFDWSDEAVTQGRLAAELTKHSDAVRQQRERSSNGGKAKALKMRGSNVPAANDRQCQPEPEPEYSSEDKSSDAVRVVVDHDRDAWNQAVTLLTGQGGMKAEKARPFFGRLLRDNGLEARDLLPSISKATVGGTQDPQGYLTRAAQAVAKRRSEPAKPRRVGWV